jgi:hypothetical protein
MGRGIITRLLSGLEETAAKLPDNRKASNGKKYELADVLKAALAVFYFRHPSLLNFQQAMMKKYRRCNLETLFGVKKIPASNRIRDILDEIEPSGLAPIMDYGIEIAQEQGILDKYRVLDGEIPVAIDGVWYFSSENVHCDHCLHITKAGETTYYHDVMAAAIVKYDTGVVLPLMLEFIRTEYGADKQDCGRNAAKRYIKGREAQLKALNPVFLGDDLYACHSICKEILSRGMSFIFTCKNESHPWIAEQADDAPFEENGCAEWNGRNHLVHRYKWLNGVENRADGENLMVNYLSYEIWNVEKNKTTYKNTWITNKTITKDNVSEIAKCGRARWKIENEHNNVLKHRGYNLEHNFGHGNKHAAEVFCLLNFLSFLIHGLQDLADEDYQKARASFGRRDEFFGALRYEMRQYPHNDWHELLAFMADDTPDG